MKTATQMYAQNINAAIIALGADRYDLLLPETHHLPTIIHDDEQIIGIVYGAYTQVNVHVSGRGVLIATTQRVLLLDKKPLFERRDELSYGVISGVSYSRAGIASTVVLHTRIGDITLRTLNKTCAQSFIQAIELKLFIRSQNNV